MLHAVGCAAARARFFECAGQETPAERTPRNDADTKGATRWQNLQLNRTRRQVVQALLRDKPQEMSLLGHAVRVGDVPAREVAAADIQNFAFTHKLFHRLPDLIPGRVTINVVHLVQIDMVGFEPAQAILTCPANMIRRQAAVVGSFPHRPIHFCREHDALAPPALCQPAPDDLFGKAEMNFTAIAIGRVKKVDAVFQGLVHDGKAIGLAGLLAEIHGA